MAAKFVALLLFVCAAQASMYTQHRPASGNPQTTTLEAQAQDLKRVASPVAQLHHQIQQIRDVVSSRVPAGFQEYANKGRQVIMQVRERIQNLIAQVHAQAQAVAASSEVSAEVDRAQLIHAIAVQCAQKSEQELVNIGEFAQNLLQEKTSNLMKDVNEDLQPLADAIQAQTELAMANIQLTVERVQALVAEERVQEAKDVLNAGRTELDKEVTAMIEKVQEMQGDYPELAQKAEVMGQEFYEATFAKATGLFGGIQKCIAEGMKNLA